MQKKNIITLNPDEFASIGAFNAFNRLIAEKLGYNLTPHTRFDRTKICVAKNIQDTWISRYEKLGYTPEFSRIMSVDIAGVKVDDKLTGNEVSVEKGFAYELMSNREIVKNLIKENASEKLQAFYMTLRREMDDTNISESNLGKDILRAYLDNDIDMLLSAMTGWDMRRLLERAGVLPEDVIIG